MKRFRWEIFWFRELSAHLGARPFLFIEIVINIRRPEIRIINSEFQTSL